MRWYSRHARGACSFPQGAHRHQHQPRGIPRGTGSWSWGFGVEIQLVGLFPKPPGARSTGVDLVVSDDHGGLVKAASKHFEVPSLATVPDALQTKHPGQGAQVPSGGIIQSIESHLRCTECGHSQASARGCSRPIRRAVSPGNGVFGGGVRGCYCSHGSAGEISTSIAQYQHGRTVDPGGPEAGTGQQDLPQHRFGFSLTESLPDGARRGLDQRQSFILRGLTPEMSDTFNENVRGCGYPLALLKSPRFCPHPLLGNHLPTLRYKKRALNEGPIFTLASLSQCLSSLF